MKIFLINQLKKSYSWVVKERSKKQKNKPLKKEIVYLLSFPNNDHGLIEELNKDYPVTVCYTENMRHESINLAGLGFKTISMKSLTGLLKTVDAVSTSKIVIADNYFAFLGDIIKKNQQTFYQLWHATGAIKQFGLEDKSVKSRSTSDKQRFKRVYDSFDYYVVGSENMADVFKRSYGATKQQMCFTGFPRTDFLVNQPKQSTSGKQTILYLPTYREGETEFSADAMVDLISQLGTEYELLIKTHPHVTLKNKESLNDYPSIKVVDNLISSDDLLLRSDIVITDYSSVAFDYALINPNGKLIFYWYDEEEYHDKTGIQPHIKNSFPSDVCHTIEEVVEQIKYQQQDLTIFNKAWNTYNDGNATNRFKEEISGKMDGIK